ncbi:uracil-DNA glycosylase [bacterium]|nr:uracil-DNA glycosylase [bacterium]
MSQLKNELLDSIRRMKKNIAAQINRGDNIISFFRTGKTSPSRILQPAAKEQDGFQKLYAQVKNCKQCELAGSRRNVVFGEGDPSAQLVFVGEAPGLDEDKSGRPFMGEEGNLLTKIIESIGLKREEVYLCNVLKCRPPGNRNPSSVEIEACQSFLKIQLDLIKPKVICALGAFAGQVLLQTKEPIGTLRGKIYTYQGIPVVPTYHPAALLYRPQNKKYVWQDMKHIALLLKSG